SPIALTSAGLSFAFRTTICTVLTVACHQSSGSCSLQSGRGWYAGYEALASARISPCSLIASVFVPDVPTSIPKKTLIRTSPGRWLVPMSGQENTTQARSFANPVVRQRRVVRAGRLQRAKARPYNEPQSSAGSIGGGPVQGRLTERHRSGPNPDFDRRDNDSLLRPLAVGASRRLQRAPAGGTSRGIAAT